MGTRVSSIRRRRSTEDDSPQIRSNHELREVFYDAPLPMTLLELEKKRLEFWETRITTSPAVWKVIRGILEIQDEDGDFETTSVMLVASGLNAWREVDHTITTYDQRGRIYCLPKYMLVQPENMIHTEEMFNYPAGEEIQILEVRIKFPNEKRIKLRVMNNTRIKDMKAAIHKEKGFIINHLMFGGKLFDDDATLFFYNVKSKSTLIATLVRAVE